MSLKRRLSPSSSTSTTDSQIYQSAPINDRKSTFLALYTPSHTLTPRTLQANPLIKDSSHRILAWRRPSTQRTLSTAGKPIYDTGSDDDGEKYAGKRLEKLLEKMDVTGVVCVGRWYGGVMLGPVRFEHIEDVAREAINKCLGERTSGAAVDGEAKRVKVSGEVRVSQVEEERLMKRLREELPKRDESILALRGLLEQKKLEAGDISSTPPPTPAKPMDYSKMPLAALKRLDKARDATIAFLLKSIDEAETEGKEMEEAWAQQAASMEEAKGVEQSKEAPAQT